ncbi:N-acetyltransferase [Curtobacterium sp. MCJR17_055]|uniref:GNAT family N-acetyltransferase n=1 Tax=unclassified Curtobacterium TaxID=257496 RepID=UPI000D908BBC|nr:MULTISPECIES: GNAT family N-acetyltransferase [unclassified Curtobacterium]PYY36030.1 N-acetyltransferase [Curtobacterium sp. MCBD17_029]PYY54868.1 N-acetyltransferase [Curtobacterium sp. MCJR17_055]PYY61104.1 N-acetyltransferase [Curtobacterium sp. MCPF17_015]
MLPVTLESARVRLDVPTRTDAPAITQACQDPEIVRWTTIPQPYRQQDATTFVDALVGPGWASDREYTWAIRRPGSTWLDGVISYRTARRDLGFWLAPSARGLGLVHDAVELVVGFAFDRGAPDVYWECYVGNTASAAVARRAGFAYTGTGDALVPNRDGSPAAAWKGLRRADGTPASDLPWPPDSMTGPAGSLAP